RRSMRLLHLRPAGERFLPQAAAPRLLRFNLLPQPLSFYLALLNVIIYFLPVPEVIGEHGVHISQLQMFEQTCGCPSEWVRFAFCPPSRVPDGRGVMSETQVSKPEHGKKVRTLSS